MSTDIKTFEDLLDYVQGQVSQQQFKTVSKGIANIKKSFDEKKTVLEDTKLRLMNIKEWNKPINETVIGKEYEKKIQSVINVIEVFEK